MMETLKQNAINPSMNGFTEDIKIVEPAPEPESEEEVIEPPKVVEAPKPTTKKWG